MSRLRLVGGLDHNFAWTGSRLVGTDLCEPGASVPAELQGAYAGVGASSADRYRLVRDPMGLNKLFWAAHADGTVLVAARPFRLIEAGCPFDSIHALPAGTIVDLDFADHTARVAKLAPGSAGLDAASSPPSVESAAQEIQRTLHRYLAALSGAAPDARAFVCLSGGLDSTGVAVLAREHFKDLTAVSFDLWHADGRPSDDRRMAERLAGDLGLPLMRVTVAPDELLEHVDTVLVEGIDWRDFNVHAGLVNAAMASAIAGTLDGSGRQPLVLTGDLMNEFLVDYQPETCRGHVYYRLPRLPPADLRTALVRGLETTHREIGLFEAWGLPTVQPYAAAADRYVALPPVFLEDPDRKSRLTRLVFGDRVPSYVYTRGKTRAQVGDADGGRGVLALCVERDVDDQRLRRRFAELHHVADLAELGRFMRGGRYRSGIPPVG